MKERTKLGLLILLFAFLFSVDLTTPRMSGSILEAFYLLQEYVQEHTLTCLIPALFIAGAIAVMISQASVIKYFGAEAKRIVAYTVASVSGSILAVCSCTILPLFAGIYSRGAGIGPAIAFVYSGPAINVLAIILTARILGWQLGLARALGAILFALIIGILMALIFRKEEQARTPPPARASMAQEGRKPWQTVLYFVLMMLVLISAWAPPTSPDGLFALIFAAKWYLTAGFLALTVLASFTLLTKDERIGWMQETWGYAKLILPLLFIGVLAAGFLLGRPGHEGIIPGRYVAQLVGGNGFGATFFASVVGAFMYFATLTEIPILQGLLGAGMGKGPALALLLAGPALSLPNMLVIRSVIGTKKTVVYVCLVIIMSTLAGVMFGNFA